MPLGRHFPWEERFILRRKRPSFIPGRPPLFDNPGITVNVTHRTVVRRVYHRVYHRVCTGWYLPTWVYREVYTRGVPTRVYRRAYTG